MALSRVVSEIFNVEKCRDLEIGVKGHSRSLRVVSSDSSSRLDYVHVISTPIIIIIVYGFLLVFCSNFVPKMHRFLDIRLQKCRDLENRVRVASRSLEISPCDRALMTSY